MILRRRLFIVSAVLISASAFAFSATALAARSRRPASDIEPTGDAATLRRTADENLDDMLKTMKDAPSEQKYYLAQKIFWLRGNFELCSFAKVADVKEAKCLQRLQPEGTPPFRDIEIGLFSEACKGAPAGRRKKECSAAAKKAQQNFDRYAKDAERLLPTDGAVAGTKFAKNPQANALDQDLRKLCDEMLKESENFADRSAPAGSAPAASGAGSSTGEK